MQLEAVRAALTRGLTEVYGIPEGIRMAAVMVPGILRDFEGMVLAAERGFRVQEEYRSEDLRARIGLTGYRDSQGTGHIDGVRVNGKMYTI